MEGTQEICKLKLVNLEEVNKQADRVKEAASKLQEELDKLHNMEFKLEVIE